MHNRHEKFLPDRAVNERILFLDGDTTNLMDLPIDFEGLLITPKGVRLNTKDPVPAAPSNPLVAVKPHPPIKLAPASTTGKALKGVKSTAKKKEELIEGQGNIRTFFNFQATNIQEEASPTNQC